MVSHQRIGARKATVHLGEHPRPLRAVALKRDCPRQSSLAIAGASLRTWSRTGPHIASNTILESTRDELAISPRRKEQPEHLASKGNTGEEDGRHRS